MIKSFGNYNIERSSSVDINNIKWTQKNPSDADKSKNKKKIARNTSPTNIIYISDIQKIKSSVEKVFKVGVNTELKNKKKKNDKRFHTSSASNCKIEPGFTRKAR